MADIIHVQVAVTSDDADSEALADGVVALGQELADLDVTDVAPATAGDAPPGAKGVELLALGGLIVQLGRSSRVLREVVDAVRDWVGRTGARSVKMTIDGDVLEVTGASTSDVQALVETWVRRHGEP